MRPLTATTLLGLACLSALGCTSYQLATLESPPAHALTAPPHGLGQICVLRPHNVASLAPAVVRDNGRLVGMTRGPTYFCYYAEPGRHVIASTYGDDVDSKLGTDQVEETQAVIAPGGRYYLHHDVSNPLVLSVQWVAEPEARTMIEECDYAELTEVPDNEALPGPGPVVVGALKLPR